MNGYKYGEQWQMQSRAVASATVIAKNDLVWVDAAASNTPKPASDFTWDTDLATTQTAFALKFLGVAAGRSRSGDTDPIMIATQGVFEFDCASATFELGALVGPAKQSGNALENQKVAATATVALSIGRVAKVGTSVTKVWVAVVSKVVWGGAQAV